MQQNDGLWSYLRALVSKVCWYQDVGWGAGIKYCHDQGGLDQNLSIDMRKADRWVVREITCHNVRR